MLVDGQASSNFIGYATSGDNNVISGTGPGASTSATPVRTTTRSRTTSSASPPRAMPRAQQQQRRGHPHPGGAQSNTIGGTTAAARNVIPGNLHEGVLVGGSGTSSNLVEGNFIGTDSTGKVLLGISSQVDGVYVGLGAVARPSAATPTGAFNTAAWNVISGNPSRAASWSRTAVRPAR